MSANTNYAETKILDAMFRGTNWTAPTTWYLALHTADPGETGATAEVATGGYARIAVTFDAGYALVAQVAWTPSGASWSLTHASVWDASSGGNCLRKGALTAPITVADGSTVVFAVGAVVMTED